MGLWGICWYGTFQQYLWIKAYPSVIPRIMERFIGCPNTIKTVMVPKMFGEFEPRKLWIGMSQRKNIQAGLTSFSDSVLNQLFFYVPCFYMLTGVTKGQSVQHSCDRLQNEYWHACLGQASFWLPVQFCNFRFVPVHLQTFVVSICNVANKTWLSWLSNRERQKELQLQKERQSVRDSVVSEQADLMTFHNASGSHEGSSTFVDGSLSTSGTATVDNQIHTESATLSLASASEGDDAMFPTSTTVVTVPTQGLNLPAGQQGPTTPAELPTQEEHHFIDKDQLYIALCARPEAVQCEEPAERSSNRGFLTGAEHEMLHR